VRIVNYRYAAAALATALVVPLFCGCQSVGGRTITVEFRSSEGLRGGDAVYLAGVQIGETSEPTVVAGKSRVPVALYRKHKDAVPAGTVFLLTTDEKRPERKCLVGYGAVLSSKGKESPGIYSGAANWIELVALVGAEKAKELVRRIGN